MTSLPPLRIESEPPRALRAAVLALGALAGVACALSEAPAWVGLAIPVLAWLEWPRRPEWRVLALGSDATLDGEPVEAMRVQRRGPLAVLSWRAKGRTQRHVFLAGAQERRALALWAGAHV